MAQFTTTEIAEKFDCTTRELRKFLRSDAKSNGGETPGKGSRYSIEGKQIASLKKRFTAWRESVSQNAQDADSDSGSDS